MNLWYLFFLFYGIKKIIYLPSSKSERMKEDILQYIWKFQYYNNSELTCTDGRTLLIFHPGNHNSHQGPDFSQAKIKIDDTIWAGNIEVHIESGHWNLHKHTGDSNYDNIILHVVWHHNAEIKDVSGNNLPTLELQSRVSKILLEKYRQLMLNPKFIACENQLDDLNELMLNNWKQRLVAERMIAKSSAILQDLKQANGHWEEVFWWYIAANFGLKINSAAFKQIAQSLPIALLSKHKHNLLQLEALLFGQARLLEGQFEDKYVLMLQKEYLCYQKKYALKQVSGELFFLRMRPANFPTIRLAQLAKLIYDSEHLFSKLKETASVKEVRKMFDLVANDYWHYHYLFERETEYKEKRLGKQMIDNIIINTVVPVLFAYGLHKDENSYKEKATSWLENLSPEKNTITDGFRNLKFENKNAYDSQAFIQLKNEYCQNKLCLKCSIGNSILKRF